ncbi:MAG TPA: NYN domain-containing protein [Candidatus Eisenbacteria bacterium]|nr:NYN domain-containing protein [Candidatus Eisenbacteria bacterium]
MAKKKASAPSEIYGDSTVERTIVIDGYNLILRSPAFRPDDRRDLAQARDKLVNLLSWAVGKGEVEFIIVFDGAETGFGPARASKSGRITVRFSKPPQNADQLIQEIVEELEDRGRTVTVVTSDLEVARHARTHGASVALSDLFAASLFPERVATDLARQKAAAEPESGADKPLGFSKKDMKEWMEMFSQQKKEEDE